MKRLTAGWLVFLLLRPATPAPCSDHVVSSKLMAIRLGEASDQRDADIATLRSFLEGPTAQRAAATVHLNPRALTGTLATLSDQDLRDLADRARHLDNDPHSGMSGGAKAVLIALAVAVALFIILLIYLATCDDCLGS